MTGLERLRTICECRHADGIIRMTRDQLRGIIDQIERETCAAEQHDTWDLLEDDAGMSLGEYGLKRMGTGHGEWVSREDMALDLVRRAKKIHERELERYKGIQTFQVEVLR